MALASVAAFLDALHQSEILEPDQLAELDRLQTQFADVRGLARELLGRDWLTPFQVNQIVQGRASELVLGQYLLLERIGEGGMGQVFKAHHRRMDRLVALKLIRQERLNSPAAIKRFHQEIKAASRLAHPNIVLALDAGQVGQAHFFVMEYVEGITLSRMVKESGPLSVGVACEYIRQTALGLQHAHEHGLVHRDIKPANLIVTGVTPVGGGAADKTGTDSSKPGPARSGSSLIRRPIVKILDMGLALLTEGEHADDSASCLTQEGALMGTVDYLAPEQAMDSHQVDIRADLYSLGCTFYYLLTGRVPFPGGAMTTKLLKHRSQEPELVGKLRPEVTPELAAVVRTLMAKSPADRYQTPADLVEAVTALTIPVGAGRTAAIRPGQSGQVPRPPAPPPTTAQEPTRDEASTSSSGSDWEEVVQVPALPPRKRTHVGRTRDTRQSPRSIPIWVWVMGAAGATLLVAVVALLGFMAFRSVPTSVGSKSRTGSAVRIAVEANRRWQDTGVDVKAGSTLVVNARGQWKKKGVTFDANGTPAFFWERGVQPEVPAMCLLGRIGNDETLLVLGTLKPVPVKQSGRLFLQVNDLDLEENSGSLQVEIDGGVPSGKAVPAPSPLPTEIAEASWKPLLARSSDPQVSGAQLRKDLLAFRQKFAGTPQARRAAELLKRYPSPLDVLQRSSIPPQEQAPWQPSELTAILGQSRQRHWGEVRSLAWAEDGRWLASGGNDRVIRLWDPASGKELAILKGNGGIVHSLAVAPDGKTLAAGNANGTIQLWDAASAPTAKNATPRSTLRGHGGPVWSIAFARDGKFLVSGGQDRTVRVWDVSAEKELAQFADHTDAVRAVAFAPDGKSVASGSQDQTIRLWDLALKQETAVLKGHKGPVYSLAYTPDGKTLASGGEDQLIRLWGIGTNQEPVTLGSHEVSVLTLVFPFDGKVLVSGAGSLTNPHQQGEVKWWDLAAKKETRSLPRMSSTVHALAMTRDSRTLATGNADGGVRLWNAADGKEPRPLEGHVGNLTAVAVRGDDQLLALGCADRTIRLWDPLTGKEQRSLGGHSGAITSTAWNADNSLLASGSEDATVRLWDPIAGLERDSLVGNAGRAMSVTFAPPGKLVAAGVNASMVKFWEIAKGRELPSLIGHKGPVAGVAYGAFGKRLASASYDGSVRVWDLASEKELLVLTGHQGKVTSVAYHPDGLMVASGGSDRTIRLWDLNTGKARAFTEHADEVRALVLAPDGKTLASAGLDGRVVWWDAASGKKLGSLECPGPVGGLAFASDSRHLITCNGNGTLFILRLAPAAQ